jgi:zinc-ribbon domain
MHCPNCGNQSELDQNFCRKCGFNLEPVSKLILNSTDVDELKLEKAKREKIALRRMVSWMMRGMLIMLIGVVLIVVSKQYNVNLFHLLPLALLGTLLTLGGVSVAMYGLLDTMRGGKAPPKSGAIDVGSRKITSEENVKADTTRDLEERLPVPLPSVTERTTQLIGNQSNSNS